jgi:hypothetical protein
MANIEQATNCANKVSLSLVEVFVPNSLENFKKRLKALEDKAANEGIILSDAQVIALEKKKHVMRLKQCTQAI